MLFYTEKSRDAELSTIDVKCDCVYSAFRFLRSQKSYEPPENAAERIDRICESQTIPVNDNTKLEDHVLRFKLFVTCEREFKHSIPNSLLYTIESIG